MYQREKSEENESEIKSKKKEERIEYLPVDRDS